MNFICSFTDPSGVLEDQVLAGFAELEELRREIASVTFEILRLCRRRNELAERIAEIKMSLNLPVEDLSVEEDLRRRALEICRSEDMDEDFCLKLLDLLIGESKRLQREKLKMKA